MSRIGEDSKREKKCPVWAYLLPLQLAPGVEGVHELAAGTLKLLHRVRQSLLWGANVTPSGKIMKTLSTTEEVPKGRKLCDTAPRLRSSPRIRIARRALGTHDHPNK